MIVNSYPLVLTLRPFPVNKKCSSYIVWEIVTVVFVILGGIRLFVELIRER